MKSFNRVTSAEEEGRCHAALESAMACVNQLAPTRWLARARSLALPPLHVRLAEGFLTLSAMLPPDNLPQAWELLKLNGRLGGPVKFSPLPGTPHSLALRAEVPVNSEQATAAQLEKVCDAFGSAILALREQEDAPAVRVEPTSVPDLVELCELAGWSHTSSRAGCCTIPLETHRCVRSALLAASAGGLHVCVELVSWDFLEPGCLEGFSQFLLSANSLLRMARTAVVEDDAGGLAQLEVFLSAPTSAWELKWALEALSVGADLCAPTAEILQHESAAKLFLSLRGGPCEDGRIEQISERNTL